MDPQQNAAAPRISALFSVVDRGSAALLAHDALVHPLPHPGRCELRLFREPERRFVRRLALSVRKATRPLSLTVDLSQPAEPGLHGAEAHVVCAGGALALHGGGADRHGASAQLCNDAGEVLWDTRALAPGDQYVFVLMRPGRHVLVERTSGWRYTLTVRYPDPRAAHAAPAATAAGPAAPARVLRLNAGDTRTPPAVVDPAQTVSVTVPQQGCGGARFEVHLEQADDGPQDLAAWRRRIDEQALARVR